MRCTMPLFFAAVAAVFVEATDVAFNKISYTSDKPRKQCMTNCVNGKCITGADRIQRRCSGRNAETAPVYYTSQYNGNHEYCLSGCGRYGYGYDWCYTTQSFSWDYCSAALRTNVSLVIGKQFTLSLGPCRNTCELKNGNYRCMSYWGDEDTCNPEGGDYIQAFTSVGTECIGTCSKHDNTKHYWCKDMSRAGQYCALPARPRLL